MARPQLAPGEHGKVDTKPNPGGTKQSAWRATARQRSSSTGVVRQRSATGRTYREATDRLMALLAQDRTATDAARKMSVQEAAAEWHAQTTALDHWADTTIQAYGRVVRITLAPMGGISLTEASPAILRKFIRAVISEHGVSAARMGRTVLRQTFSWAISEGMIAAPNPADGIKLPKKSDKKPRALTADQLEDFFTVAAKASPRVRDAVLLQLAAGLRVGELLGLRRRDVLSVNGSVRIQIAGTVIQPTGKAPYRRDAVAKTVSSIRKVPVLDFGVEALRRRIEMLDIIGETSPDALLFGTVEGGVVSPNNHRRDWRSVRDSSETTRGLRLHDLRATYASIAMASRVPDTQIAQLLGHKGTGPLYDFYFARPDTIEHEWKISPASAPTPSELTS